MTIVLFSRTFYKANEWSDFPEYMQECLQQDYKGRYIILLRNPNLDFAFPPDSMKTSTGLWFKMKSLRTGFPLLLFSDKPSLITKS